MKKTLITLLAFASVSYADDVTLRYAFTDFKTDGTAPDNVAANLGTTTIEKKGYVNYAGGVDITGVEQSPGSMTVANGHPFHVTDTNGLVASGSDVLKTDDGFTLVFNANVNTNWGDIGSVTISSVLTNQTFKFETDSSTTNIQIYTQTNIGDQTGTQTGAATLAGISRATWYNFALTAQGGNYTLSAWSAAGDKVSSVSWTGLEGTLISYADVANDTYIKSQGKNNNLLDNIGIYDGVLTDDNLSALVLSEAAGSGMIQSFSANIPEPTTATLSLLALAGLAARRRRK